MIKKLSDFAVITIFVIFFVTSFLFAGCKDTQPMQPSMPVPSQGSAPGGTFEQPARPEIIQGLNFYHKHDYDKVIKAFTAAIEKYPNDEVAYYDRATVFMEQKKYAEAKNDLIQAVAINPKNPVPHYNLAALYSLQDQRDQALSSLDRALELGFRDIYFLFNDSDLNNVRKHPGFMKVLEKHKIVISK